MSAPYYVDDAVTLWLGDCLEILATLPDASVDSIVTDPPYGLEFMGKSWDRLGDIGQASHQGFTDGTGFKGLRLPTGYNASANVKCGRCAKWRYDHVGRKCECGPEAVWPNVKAQQARAMQEWHEAWVMEAFRVLKPGGHMLAFGGSRTWHRLACAVEDAGFEIRDSIAWLYGSGFPKSLDVSKAIDKAAGVEREIVGRKAVSRMLPNDTKWGEGLMAGGVVAGEVDITAPATPDAARWQGWGTALKPAYEPVVVGRKPAGHGAILESIGSHLDSLGAAWQALELAPTTRTGAAADSSAATATSRFESATEMSSNTVTSWRECWVEICSALSTSTTATTSSTTTDLRTLSSSLSRLTAESTQALATSRPGSTSLASAVDNLFASVVCGLRATLALSATEPATASTPPARRDAPASGSAFEPIVVGRKPLIGTVAANVLAHGTGALNIDGCRVGTSDTLGRARGGWGNAAVGADNYGNFNSIGITVEGGRWPANVILDDSQAAELDRQSGSTRDGVAVNRNKDATAIKPASVYGDYRNGDLPDQTYGGGGGASRFFPTFRYEAKAPTSERPRVDGIAHATVKPVDLMRWLVRLVTPPGGTVLDPFAGSGTTAEACVVEGFRCVLIEREADYLPLIVARLSKPIQVGLDFGESA